MINLIVAVAGGIVAMVVGMLWYGPLFGKKWFSLAHPGADFEKMKTEGQKSMMPSMAMMFLANVVLSGVLSYFVSAMGGGLYIGLMTAFIVWLGFIATVGLSNVLFEGKPKELYLLNMGCQLVTLLIVGAVAGIL